MKRNKFFCASGFFVLAFFVGCKTPPKINLVDYSPVAVMSVYSNSSVPWYSRDDEKSADDGSLVTSDLNKVLERNNPEYQTVQSRIDEAADILRRTLEENSVSLVDIDRLKDTTVYGNGYNKFMQKATTSTAADGYMVLDYNGTARNRLIANETGAGGTLFAEFIFQKEKVQSGLFDLSVAARVTMKVYVADSSGKKVLYKTYRGVSMDSVPYNNGNWDRDALVGYFPEVIESVVARFVMDYIGLEND